MKNTVLLLLFLAGCMGTMQGQATLRTSEAINGFNSIPQEEVFVHHNTSLLFTGEYLYYKLYCLDTSTQNLSSISKIGYVELVGADSKTVFKHKIRLENGLGQGDFFLPPSVVSGNYKLLGYTQWMTNGEKNYFYHQDISVINPYQENQDAILKATDTLIGDLPAPPVMATGSSNATQINGHLEIVLPSPQYGKRGLVSMQLKALKGSDSYGNYSISVRKVDEVSNVPTKISARQYKVLYENSVRNSNTSGKQIALPELRGELITGKVMANGSPAVNKEVAFSIPGKDYIFAVANTNKDGVFYLNLNSDYDQENAIAQVVDAEPANYTIEFLATPSVNISDLPFHSFKVSKAYKDLILERSIYNQVENGYFTVKTDSVQPADALIPFYGTPTESYNLDDFTRFPTVRETLLEVIDNAWVKNTGDGNSIFQIRSQDFSANANALPLVLVDGVMIQDHNDFVDFNARKLQHIRILKDQYFLGSQVFQGVIDIETINGDFQNTYYKDYINNVTLFKAQPLKEYYKQTYFLDKEAETKRIPDFRYQLLWKPDLTFSSEAETVSFYTSDNLGAYEISIQGFTNIGTPVSITETFVVRE